MKTSNILWTIFFTLLAARFALAFFDIHFTSFYHGEFFLLFLSLLAVVAWFLRLRRSESRIILVASSVAVYALLSGILSLYNNFRGVDELHPEPFHNTDKLISGDFDFDMAGPHFDVSVGNTYLWGLLYKEDLAIRIDGEGPLPVPERFELPEGVSDSTGCECWFWEEGNLLFDFDTHTVYELELREELSIKEAV